MTSVIEVLFARRPEINYVSPPACEVVLSAFSGLLITLSPIGRIPAVGGLIITGEWPGPFFLNWGTEPGEGPPVICYNIYKVEGATLLLVAECINPPPGGGGVELPGEGTYIVTPVTPEGEGPPSEQMSTPPQPPEPPLDCSTNEGVDTTCAYGPTGDRYRIKNYNASLWDISACGLSWTNCIVCEISPDVGCVSPVPWQGTWPLKVNDTQFITQEFELDPSCGDCFPSACPSCQMPPEHLLQGFCLSATLQSSGAPNSTGCGWAIVMMGYLGEHIWTGIKSKGEGPVGKYFRTGGCSLTPECVEVEAY